MAYMTKQVITYSDGTETTIEYQSQEGPTQETPIAEPVVEPVAEPVEAPVEVAPAEEPIEAPAAETTSEEIAL